MTKLVQAPPVQSSVSWWANLPPKDFTKQAEKEQARMSASTLGKGRGRAISSEELNK